MASLEIATLYAEKGFYSRSQKAAPAGKRRLMTLSMKNISILIFLFAISALASSTLDLKQLQGAWWSDSANSTADFSIEGSQVWLDYDSQYHPCRIEGDVLVFDLGNLGLLKNRIISLKCDKLVLEHLETKHARTLTRAKQPY